jgi:hypothetical protein
MTEFSGRPCKLERPRRGVWNVVVEANDLFPRKVWEIFINEKTIYEEAS